MNFLTARLPRLSWRILTALLAAIAIAALVLHTADTLTTASAAHRATPITLAADTPTSPDPNGSDPEEKIPTAPLNDPNKTQPLQEDDIPTWPGEGAGSDDDTATGIDPGKNITQPGEENIPTEPGEGAGSDDDTATGIDPGKNITQPGENAPQAPYIPMPEPVILP